MTYTACIFPPDTPVSGEREAWFRESGFECIPWPGRGEQRAVLLAGPVKCSNEEFVHPEGVWRHYLAERHPEARLILIGLRRDLAGPNYMHWFFPPEGFRSFWQAALPARDMELPAPLGFPTLETLWQRFMDGHDKGGFNYYFTWGKTPVQVAWDNLAGRPDRFETQLIFLRESGAPGFLRDCRERWAYYLPYWEAVPFAEEIAQLDAHVSQLNLDPASMADWETLLKKLAELKEHITAAERIIGTISPYFKT